MASYNVTVPHALDAAAARSRVERFLDEVQRDYAAHVSDVAGQWSDNALQFGFTTTGMRINGTLVVGEDAVQVTGSLPLMASLFRGRIEQTIREHLQKLLT
jgi:putative polyhydroxyalkanoate system protein